MNLIIFGPQGSGKGTQADALSEKLNIPHITMGDLLRVEAKSGSELGQKINLIINEGKLVPDETVFNLIKDRLSMLDCESGYILDGFPRNLKQAKLLDGITKIERALEIWISDEESIKRISGRQTCSKCGAVYHLEFNPPQNKGKCDKCQIDLIIREDDKEEVIKKRLAVYHEETEPLARHYKDVHLKIDGMPAIMEVTKEVFEKLEISN